VRGCAWRHAARVGRVIHGRSQEAFRYPLVQSGSMTYETSESPVVPEAGTQQGDQRRAGEQSGETRSHRLSGAEWGSDRRAPVRPRGEAVRGIERGNSRAPHVESGDRFPEFQPTPLAGTRIGSANSLGRLRGRGPSGRAARARSDRRVGRSRGGWCPPAGDYGTESLWLGSHWRNQCLPRASLPSGVHSNGVPYITRKVSRSRVTR
jgi:hypothetical protein